MKRVIFCNDDDNVPEIEKLEDEEFAQASDNSEDESLLFTPAAIVDFLSQIDELSSLDIGVDHVSDNVTVHVGESSYLIKPKGEEVEIEVDPNEIDEVNDATEEAYNNIENLVDVEDDVVESGIIKEFIKTLAVGGLVRLAAKKLKK